MMRGTLTGLAFVAGCAIALAVPAVQAQTLDSQISMYDRLLELNPAYRESRILRECGPITNVYLQAVCVDSFYTSEDQPSLGRHERMTDSTGTMVTIGKPPYRLDMYSAGTGR
jgi:hypothetical protein